MNWMIKLLCRQHPITFNNSADILQRPNPIRQWRFSKCPELSPLPSSEHPALQLPLLWKNTQGVSGQVQKHSLRGHLHIKQIWTKASPEDLSKCPQTHTSFLRITWSSAWQGYCLCYIEHSLFLLNLCCYKSIWLPVVSYTGRNNEESLLIFLQTVSESFPYK